MFKIKNLSNFVNYNNYHKMNRKTGQQISIQQILAAI